VTARIGSDDLIRGVVLAVLGMLDAMNRHVIVQSRATGG
jgi:hypothetical protein